MCGESAPAFRYVRSRKFAIGKKTHLNRSWIVSARCSSVLARSCLRVDQRLDVASTIPYPLARMRYEIILSPEAVEDLNRLSAHRRTTIRESIESHLRHEPRKVSKSRIKRLRGMVRPQYRLRVGDVRVYYDVSEDTVAILAIVPKSESADWLEITGEI